MYAKILLITALITLLKISNCYHIAKQDKVSNYIENISVADDINYYVGLKLIEDINNRLDNVNEDNFDEISKLFFKYAYLIKLNMGSMTEQEKLKINNYVDKAYDILQDYYYQIKIVR